VSYNLSQLGWKAFQDLVSAVADQADLRHCSAHGLRKAGATIAANNGATSRQLMAIFGWYTLKEAERYTRKADQERLAESAMHMLEVRDPAVK
jgi:integrase